MSIKEDKAMNESKPLGFGLVGCGDFGRFCLAAYGKVPEVRIAAVADVRREAADALGGQFGVPAFYDARELIRRSEVDIVHVATPPSTHHELAISAIRAGKHVLCEKPLAMSLRQADEMLAAAAGAGVILPVNFVLRYNRVTEAAKAVIDSGILGRVLAARLTNCAFDSLMGPEHWFWKRDVSGGIFIEHGVHFFDLYNHWLGPGRVINAHAEAREGTGQQDRVTCTILHDRGAVASHYHGFDQIKMMDRADHRLICEMGDIRVEGWIPLALSVDAAVDADGAARLAECCPGGEVEVIEEYDPEQGRIMGRGKLRAVTRRIRMRYRPDSDKQAVYAAGIGELLTDQIAYIRDRSHARRVTESNGRDALALAQAADELAAGRKN